MILSNDYLALLHKWEGGYVNNPIDKGGETNRGITAATYRQYLNETGDKRAPKLKELDEATYRRFIQWYFNRLLVVPKIEYQVLREVLFDFGWWAGNGNIDKYICAGHTPAETVTNLNRNYAVNPVAVVDILHKIRLRLVKDSVDRSSGYKMFERGFINRANELYNYARGKAAQENTIKGIVGTILGGLHKDNKA
jgi:lysozyme family protein